jgi:hypothetical protein
MNARVQYLIAQYQADPLRKEPRNVGVIARMGERTLSRFLGEDETGTMDRRKLRPLNEPDVFLQWVKYWQDQGQTVPKLEDLIDGERSNYGLIKGGNVLDIGDDPLEQVVDHLYSRFVGKGFAEAVREGDPVLVTGRQLANSIATELLDLNIHVDDHKTPEGIVHPVRRRQPVVGGGSVVYRPEFSQENSVLYLIETFDFTHGQGKRLYEHAGLTAYMYKDIHRLKGPSGMKAISVVKTDPDATATEYMENSRKMLGNEGELVDWNDEAQRRAFLDERKQVAVG